MYNNVLKVFKNRWFLSCAIGAYVLGGILPFWYRLYRHFIETFVEHSKELGEYLAIDFSWYELHNTIWIQFPLFIVAWGGIIWLSRGNVWRQILLAVIFLEFAIPPLFLVTVQTVYIPKYELSSCSQYPIYAQPDAWDRMGLVYLKHNGELKEAGEVEWCTGNSCNLFLWEERVQQIPLSEEEAKQCVKPRHDVDFGDSPVSDDVLLNEHRR